MFGTWDITPYFDALQELKEDNRVLQETKEVLEDQLAGWRARSDTIHQLEKHSLLLKAQVHDMEQVRCYKGFKQQQQILISSKLCVPTLGEGGRS